MGSVMSGRAGNSAAGVSARAAQIKTLERHPIIGGPDHRPSTEQLVETHFSMEDVASDQPEGTPEVGRRRELAADHRFGKARSVGVDRGDDLVGGFLALVIPAPTRPKVVPEMLAKGAPEGV